MKLSDEDTLDCVCLAATRSPEKSFFNENKMCKCQKAQKEDLTSGWRKWDLDDRALSQFLGQEREAMESQCDQSAELNIKQIIQVLVKNLIISFKKNAAKIKI